MRTLLRSLDDSFSHIVLMIKERSDFRTLVPADVVERLKTHEMEEEEEKHDVNGSRRRTPTLKASASHHYSSDSGSASVGDSDDPASIGKDLALIIRCFSRFQKKSSSSPKKNYSPRQSSNSSQYRSSSRNPSVKDNSCFKCKKSGHFIAECPCGG